MCYCLLKKEWNGCMSRKTFIEDMFDRRRVCVVTMYCKERQERSEDSTTRPIKKATSSFPIFLLSNSHPDGTQRPVKKWVTLEEGSMYQHRWGIRD
jgi:hypothetical protein